MSFSDAHKWTNTSSKVGQENVWDLSVKPQTFFNWIGEKVSVFPFRGQLERMENISLDCTMQVKRESWKVKQDIWLERPRYFAAAIAMHYPGCGTSGGGMSVGRWHVSGEVAHQHLGGGLT